MYDIEVKLVGGPYDGHRQKLMTIEDLNGPREKLGTWMPLNGYPWPDDVPEGCVPRAVYEPDPPPAEPTIWRYRGIAYT